MSVCGARTLARHFDSLESINAVSQVLHCLGCKVFGCLHLQQEDGGCDIYSVGLRCYYVAVAEGPCEEVEDH